MSLIPGVAEATREDAVQLATYLVEQRGLSLEALQQVIALQRAQELRFSEAALLLGLVRQADLDAARQQGHAPTVVTRGHVTAELNGLRERAQVQTPLFGALRAQLLLKIPAGQGLKLAVVSAEPGDGRSYLAAALAMACAQTGQPTLLIDADLRSPCQHRLFNLDTRQGLLQALSGAALPRPAEIEGLTPLSVLPAGGSAVDALELVSSRPFRSLVESFGSRYRHIIIDTPAASAGFDATAVAIACGAALLLARRNYTALAPCRQLVTQLRAAPVQLLGSVML